MRQFLIAIYRHISLDGWECTVLAGFVPALHGEWRAIKMTDFPLPHKGNDNLVKKR